MCSNVLDAEEVVGRIIRARNPSSAGALEGGKLCLDDCFFNVEGGGPREGLLLCPRVDGLRVKVDVVVARLGERDSGWEFPDARLRERRITGAGAAAEAVLEPEEAVCAVKEAGSFTGLVGDLGFGLTNPV